MPKRKVVGGYDFFDEEDDEPTSAPPPKKPHRPLTLQTPEFKLPTASRVQSNLASRPQPVSSSPTAVRTSGQRVATPLSTHTMLLTPRDTPGVTSRGATEPLSELDEREAQAGPSAQTFPSRLAYERQLHELESSVAESTAVIADQAKEVRYLRNQVGDSVLFLSTDGSTYLIRVQNKYSSRP
ncbi:hypothetical protein FRC08_014062 [Ceratobasidium sp. 394]|nr:hypothetical protein FRC08_014062 [Ceratobasidium sp. 394]KAG9097575.1 hypothetical protein FS749_005988 [Ceratobasidium sp. UAMH 11750]